MTPAAANPVPMFTATAVAEPEKALDSLEQPIGSAAAAPAPEPWRVLIVDDDADVHLATELAMRDLPVEGRPLAFLHARSAREALEVVAADDAIAVVLLDVVMETPDAGLRLVRRIRQELGRRSLRIVLRTGQPGYAPEIETLRDYDINDYRTKAELTRVRLFSSLTTAVRAYAQLEDLTRQRDELGRLNAELERARAAERAETARRAAAEAALQAARESVEHCVAQRTQELSQAVAELDHFNRMVSHDLSGPLHGLASMAGLIQDELQRGDPAQKVQRWLQLMEQQTRLLAGLVGDLLTLSRVSQGRLARAPVPLAEVVGHALQSLALQVEATRLAAVEVGELPVLAVDAALMRQVFVNLLSNALKFARDAKPPRIQVSATHEGGEWVFAVRDNGVGFDARRASELFRPFSRLHAEGFEGTGVGLTIVQRVVERHGGRIWADSPAGDGAVFRFALPAAD